VLYIVPSVVALALIVVVPTVFLYYVSLTSFDLVSGWDARQFIGLGNFGELLRDPEFWHATRLSLQFMIAVTLVEFVLGFTMALLFQRRIAGKAVMVSLLMIPMIVTPSIVSLMWKLMYNAEFGVLNYFLGMVGVQVNWLVDGMAFWSVALVDVWQWTPFMMLVLYAGLQAIPQDPYEAAVVDGASGVQVLWYVTLPLLRPIITLALILRSMDALKLFDIIFGLTQGGPGTTTELLSMRIYRLAFAHTGWVGKASANAVILVILVTILATVMIRFMREVRGTG